MEKINKEIVLLLINGSHSAFSKIYVKCHRQFFLLALRYLKSKEMAEDAVQYSFMRLWETRTQIDVEQGVEPYLYGSLKNHLLNTYKFHQLTLEKKEEIILGMPLFEEENITQTLYRKQRDEAIRKASTKAPHLPNENFRRTFQCRDSPATQHYSKYGKSILLQSYIVIA